ncbi:MAG: peptide-methionine (S)-S-oxide reductase MsrA [Candidatus Moranbacteria bacterium]|jgi:peptide-methionine (S)-S-oxide reductase|nr:peptide-methionine (S)-S-oxide reductase MsrA [Candidatus Moranbacteria bacterium]MDD5651769.1 peptide-methionine (S)-S-oxide reductase MsrA [Candidatus Moranbacteria bacterium]MDX9855665.1 peptide-methionine (S)-S-oxide reductase MsrA [Candidatus Moranbacteria bacterium]
MGKEIKEAYFGGGCFWCTEALFFRLKGVIDVISGYAGGTIESPTYEKVCTGKTGHAEVVKIKYDPDIIGYETLVSIFFSTHDPTTLDRQGNDTGTQYRSIILYGNDEEKEIAQKVIDDLESEGVYGDPIVTEIVPFDKFYPAEDYHQKYYENNPEQAYCQAIIAPKLIKFREKFKKYYKESNK